LILKEGAFSSNLQVGGEKQIRLPQILEENLSVKTVRGGENTVFYKKGGLMRNKGGGNAKTKRGAQSTGQEKERGDDCP